MRLVKFNQLTIFILLTLFTGGWAQQRQLREKWRNDLEINQKISWIPMWSNSWNGRGLEKFDPFDGMRRQGHVSDPYSSSDSDSDTWLSSSYLTPPPRPRQSRGEDFKSDHHIYDYTYYDRATYSVPNLMKIYQNHFQNSPINQGMMVESERDWNQMGSGQNNLIVSVPVKEKYDQDLAMTSYNREPLVMIDMQRVMKDLNSVCSYFLPNMHTRFFCSIPPTAV